MQNQYEVEIDGTLYRVTIEEISHSERSQAPAPAPTPAVAPVAAPAPAAPASGNGKPVNSPMAGKIFKVLAQPGQAVKRGEPVVILEAMKMENEIVSPEDGVISEILVNEGQTVESNDVLFKL